MSTMLAPRPIPDTPAGAPYTGPERRRNAAGLQRGELLPLESVYLVMPEAAQDLTLQGQRSRVVDEIQEAVCAAMSGESPLFDLIRRRVLMHCAMSPGVSAAAADELDRLLAVDIVQRHFHACDKRRRLLRELMAVAGSLRDGSSGS